MINPHLWLDDKLSAATQRFCDKFLVVTGQTKFFLQKWLLILSGTFLWTAFILEPMILGMVLAAVYSFGIWCTIDNIKKEEEQFLKSRALSESTWHDVKARLSTFVYVATTAAIALFGAPPPFGILVGPTLIVLTVYPYIAACVPRPPSRSKAREWCEKALTALNDILKPAPTLAPVKVPSR